MAEILLHNVIKVRAADAVAVHSGRDHAFLTLRPFAPGTEPAFVGSLWFHDRGSAEPRTPGLHLLPVDADPARPSLLYMNLFFDNQTGGSSLLDRSPGWRRLDFTFALPEAAGGGGGYWVRVVVEGTGTEPTVIDVGTLAVTHEVWHFRPTAGNRLPVPPPEPPPLRPGFVGGAPKSGTTWMQLLLNQHPQVFAMGEGSMLEPVTVRPWQPVNRWFPRNTTPATQITFATHATMLRTLQTYRDMLGCGWIIDKSPGNALYYRKLLAYQPAAQLVHCVRHPLDVLVSRLHHEANLIVGGKPSPDMAIHAEVIARLPALLAQPGPLALDARLWELVARVLDDYAQAQHEALETVQERPGRLLIVRYEDMLQDAASCAARVFQHLGVATDAAQIDDCVRNVSFANLRERRSGRDHQFFRAGMARQYLDRFTPADRLRAMGHLSRALPQFAELGYEVMATV